MEIKQRYAYLEHMADAKFHAFGNSLEEAFVNAALATAGLMWDWTRIIPEIKHPVEVMGHDLQQLLLSFLEEVLFLLDSQMFLLHSVEEVQVKRHGEQYVLKAIFLGDDSKDSYEIYGSVKAITYNEMKVEKTDLYRLQVVVDM
jgi:SHS2 domain-containing protein